MPIQFACPFCGKQTIAGDEFAGRSGPCAGCGNTITLPGGTPSAFSDAPQGTAPPSSNKVLWIVAIVLCCVLAIPCLGVVTAILLPAVQRAREAGNRVTCTNNLKHVMLAMHNYHDTHNNFPPAYTVDKNGNKLHSWRTLLLPYFGDVEADAIHRQLRLDEPWDSEHNLPLLQHAMKYYQCPSAARDNLLATNYLLVTGPGTAFVGAKPPTINSIGDGTHNTIFVVETDDDSISWMEPQDMDIEKFVNRTEKRQSVHPQIFNVALGDGSVRQIRTNTGPVERRALVTANGGEATDFSP